VKLLRARGVDVLRAVSRRRYRSFSASAILLDCTARRTRSAWAAGGRTCGGLSVLTVEDGEQLRERLQPQ
jgi:hypothetical protein